MIQEGPFAISFEDIVDIFIDDKKIEEKVNKVIINSFFKINTFTNDIRIERTIYNSLIFPCSITKFVISNPTIINKKLKLSLSKTSILINDNVEDDKNYYVRLCLNKSLNEITYDLKSHETIECYLYIMCNYKNHNYPVDGFNEYENNLKSRLLIKNKYIIETSNPIINGLALKCKQRSAETVFYTINGFMHSPCGGQYYAGIWTNDQLEYLAPFFAYFDYVFATKAICNAFDMFSKYAYKTKPIVSSIIAQGKYYWNEALDRGDNEMYVYGLCNYLLTTGNIDLAKKYIVKIQKALSYIEKKKNKDGIIFSNTDELENRFESGSYNLATNSLAYGAFKFAGRLFNELGIENNYEKEAINLKESIAKYFHLKNHYIYCKEETHLRSHIFYPIIMGIMDYKDDIIKDLTNPLLLNDNGFKIIDNDKTIWDRATLMAIRAMFLAGYPNQAYEILLNYSKNRLLGNHVPYAIEAYPEGNQAQLSAENALYERIFLEGILGFEPLSFKKFKLRINMPDNLGYLAITDFKFNNHFISLFIRKGISTNLLIIGEKTKIAIKNGEELIVDIDTIFKHKTYYK